MSLFPYMPSKDEDRKNNPIAFDEKGRPWVEGEIEDINKIVFMMFVAGAVILTVCAGLIYLAVNWISQL